MKDLKYLLYFENLLQEAHNDLIAQAQNEGKICVAYACENTPEPLLNLPGAFSTRLRAPRTGSMEMATYYMTSFLCEYSRALLERAVEGGFNFADCVIAPDGCTMINRCRGEHGAAQDHGRRQADVLLSSTWRSRSRPTTTAWTCYVLQCRNHILTPLHDAYRHRTCPTPPSARRWPSTTACARSSARSATSARRPGRASRVTNSTCMTLATYVAPKYLLIDKLEETLEEAAQTREPGERRRTARASSLVGSEVDDSEFIKLIEDTGAYVCADRFCFGSLPGRDPIVLTDDEDALTQVCRQYVYRGQCPRYDEHGKGLIGRKRVRRPTSPENTTPTASSTSRSSSATRGRMSARSARTMLQRRLRLSRCCPWTARTTSAPQSARCARACRPSSRAWRSRRYREVSGNGGDPGQTAHRLTSNFGHVL